MNEATEEKALDPAITAVHGAFEVIDAVTKTMSLYLEQEGEDYLLAMLAEHYDQLSGNQEKAPLAPEMVACYRLVTALHASGSDKPIVFHKKIDNASYTLTVQRDDGAAPARTVAPKVVVEELKRMAAGCHTRPEPICRELWVKLGKIIPRIVELPEPEPMEIVEDDEAEQFVGVTLGGSIVDVSTPAEALQLAANAYKAAEILAAEQKEGK